MNQRIVSLIAAAGALAVSGAGFFLLPMLESEEAVNTRLAAEHVYRAQRLLDKYDATVTKNAVVRTYLRDNLEVDVNADDPGAAAAIGRIESKNAAYLTDAMREVDEAIRVSDGYAEGHRLKGVILYHMGLADAIRAQEVSGRAGSHRGKLAAYAARIEGLSPRTTLADESQIGDRVAEMKQEDESLEEIINTQSQDLAELDQTIAQLKDRIAAAQQRADQARLSLDQLRREGIDFSDPKGNETFAARYGALSEEYRRALREVHALTRGDFPYAQIDQTGDFLIGRYLENGSPDNLTAAPGLAHYVDQRTALALYLEGSQRRLETVRSDIARFEETGARHLQTQNDATEAVDQARAFAREVFDELTRIEDEAHTAEEDALNRFNQSVRASSRAASTAGAWVSDGGSRASEVSLEARDSSAFQQRTTQRWMSGYANAQQADALLAAAWIHYERYARATKNAEVLASSAEVLELSDANAEEESQDAESAKSECIDAVDQAMQVLQNAHRDTGRHWTLTAQAAGITYLMVLLGDESYLTDVLANYRSAVQGREGKDYVRAIERRISQLEKRQPSGG